ncbi:MAG: calcium-translocating P-type ATPase, PMCA-type [Acutalibacteraceae bacterium]|jgi:Ca2+-transporting ATPase
MIWHSEKPGAIFEQLDTDPERGMTTDRAVAKWKKYGPNKLDEQPPRSWIRRFGDQLKNAMIIILLIAAAVSLGLSVYHAYIGEEADWIEPVVIVAIVLVNALLGVFQESRAEKALDALKSMTSPVARVRRDGVLTVLPSSALVPGDIIELEAGDLIPADCRLLRSAAFKCDESALTGESLPVDKTADAAVVDMAPLGDRFNMAYAGCAVTNGTALAVVVETGMFTEMGKIAGMLQGEAPAATPLQRRLERLGKTLGYLALAVCAVIFVIGLFKGIGVASMFMTAVSLAVAAIPEGLPAIVTIVLALGVQRMVKQNAIIRRLPAVETLGSASVICTDKTGTLTQNRMTLRAVYADGRIEPLEGAPSDAAMAVVRMGALCTDATLQESDGEVSLIGDPTETAILLYAHQQGLTKEMLQAENPRLLEMPFDSDRKLMSTVHLVGERRLVVVKGAPEILCERCVEGYDDRVEKAYEEMGRDALRVLAIAYKYVDEIPVDCRAEDLECDLRLAGLVGMIDPPRPEAMRAIRECRSAGIRTVMITGDHVRTASAIARQLGILYDEDEAITGEELSRLSDEELFENIRKFKVYARVTPADKLRIIKAWQKAGEVVSMTGDGVNDAPALKAADIGCAMGITGTDVAKGAADMILTDDNFATIVTAVRTGRGIYDNIRKAVRFLLSCNFGEILAVFFAMLIWNRSPLAAVQLLWINLVTDSLPALALGMEPADRGIMQRPPRAKRESVFAGGMGWDVAIEGALIAALTLIGYAVGGATVAFLTLAFTQLVHAFNSRTSRSLLRVGLHGNWYMVGAAAISAGLMVLAVAVPGLRPIFGTQALTGGQWWTAIGLAAVMWAAVEIKKVVAAIVRAVRAKK